MSVVQFPPAGQATVQPVGALGTYNLSVPLTPGLYQITTDTTQTFTTAQLYFQTALGYRFGAVVRGGVGYVAVPETVTTVTFGSGTFPLLIGFQRFGSYTLLSAPTNAVFSYSTAFSPYNFTLTYTAPAGATSIGIYWTNGTFTDTTSTSGTYSSSLPTTPTFGVAYPALVVAKDANGVWGLGVSPTGNYPYAVFTSSGTYATPSWSTQADIYICGGGGGGGGCVTSSNSGVLAPGGGGGAAQFREFLNQATSGNITVTVGAGGNGGTSGAAAAPNAGGTTTFGNLASAGGGGRGASTNFAASSGGGSGGGASRFAALANGIAGAGTAGSNSGGYWNNNEGSGHAGGAGGGFTNAAVAPGTNGANAPGIAGNGVTRLGVSLAGGGNGGEICLNITGPQGNNTTTYGGGGGGGGGRYPNTLIANAGSAGTTGIVMVYAKP